MNGVDAVSRRHSQNNMGAGLEFASSSSSISCTFDYYHGFQHHDLTLTVNFFTIEVLSLLVERWFRVSLPLNIQLMRQGG
jgi:hypothetical protein